jgi:protein-S-isoprenylcysteine O-methyltransferase Ste14
LIFRGQGLLALTYIVPLVVVAYLLFFLYDWRIVSREKSSGSMVLFFAGCALVLAATVLLLVTQLPSCPWDALSFIFLALALVSAVLMMKALFFSLPANTYTAPEQARHTYACGMYALCRHPGVLWYCLMFISLAIMLRTPAAFIGCCVLCAGDIAYMVFQDVWSFPRTFCDYAAYKRNVPLFFPTRESFRAAFLKDDPETDGGTHESF